MAFPANPSLQPHAETYLLLASVCHRLRRDCEDTDQLLAAVCHRLRSECAAVEEHASGADDAEMMCAFLDQLPASTEETFAFIGSRHALSLFSILRHEGIARTLASNRTVGWLLENVEEDSIYWHEQLLKGKCVPRDSLQKLSCKILRLKSLKVSY
eukprot:JP447365.1.p1 GENE.JP447365.1~~JP447365.1.p1  ORF type:complete len:156 (+),score=29.50 JP447365.1:33-500(+)